MMQERMSLSNYLLSGSQSDFSEIEKNHTLFKRLLDDAKRKAVSDRQRGALASVESTEQAWYDSFPKQLIEKRKQIVGNRADELRRLYDDFYASNNAATTWVKSLNDSLNEAENASQEALVQWRTKDNDAHDPAFWINSIETVIAVLLGLGISSLSAKSISHPLGPPLIDT